MTSHLPGGMLDVHVGRPWVRVVPTRRGGSVDDKHHEVAQRGALPLTFVHRRVLLPERFGTRLRARACTFALHAACHHGGTFFFCTSTSIAMMSLELSLVSLVIALSFERSVPAERSGVDGPSSQDVFSKLDFVVLQNDGQPRQLQDGKHEVPLRLSDHLCDSNSKRHKRHRWLKAFLVLLLIGLVRSVVCLSGKVTSKPPFYSLFDKLNVY